MSITLLFVPIFSVGNFDR